MAQVYGSNSEHKERDMKKEFDRRKFNGLTAAAFGGLLAGSVAGCGGGDDDDTSDSGDGDDNGGDDEDSDDEDSDEEDSDDGDDESGDEVAANDWTGDTHVCRGLNACKGKGAGGENECAGQGVCATAKAHTCHEANDCKYQGGCGESVGQNGCNGKGECGVPLKDSAWAKARKSYEAALTSAEKKLGDAPAKPEEE